MFDHDSRSGATADATAGGEEDEDDIEGLELEDGGLLGLGGGYGGLDLDLGQSGGGGAVVGGSVRTAKRRDTLKSSKIDSSGAMVLTKRKRLVLKARNQEERVSFHANFHSVFCCCWFSGRRLCRFRRRHSLLIA
jgi:hypothetical protein